MDRSFRLRESSHDCTWKCVNHWISMWFLALVAVCCCCLVLGIAQDSSPSLLHLSGAQATCQLCRGDRLGKLNPLCKLSCLSFGLFSLFSGGFHTPKQIQWNSTSAIKTAEKAGAIWWRLFIRQRTSYEACTPALHLLGHVYPAWVRQCSAWLLGAEWSLRILSKGSLTAEPVHLPPMAILNVVW